MKGFSNILMNQGRVGQSKRGSLKASFKTRLFCGPRGLLCCGCGQAGSLQAFFGATEWRRAVSL